MSQTIAPQHDINCEWQFDQYSHECTCGVMRPRTPWFVPFSFKTNEATKRTPSRRKGGA